MAHFSITPVRFATVGLLNLVWRAVILKPFFLEDDQNFILLVTLNSFFHSVIISSIIDNNNNCTKYLNTIPIKI